MTQRLAPLAAPSSRSRRYWAALTSWYSSTEIQRKQRLDGRQHVGMFFQQADGQQDQVVEVDRVARAQRGFVAAIDVRGADGRLAVRSSLR